MTQVQQLQEQLEKVQLENVHDAAQLQVCVLVCGTGCCAPAIRTVASQEPVSIASGAVGTRAQHVECVKPPAKCAQHVRM